MFKIKPGKYYRYLEDTEFNGDFAEISTLKYPEQLDIYETLEEATALRLSLGEIPKGLLEITIPTETEGFCSDGVISLPKNNKLSLKNTEGVLFNGKEIFRLNLEVKLDDPERDLDFKHHFIEYLKNAQPEIDELQHQNDQLKTTMLPKHPEKYQYYPFYVEQLPNGKHIIKWGSKDSVGNVHGKANLKHLMTLPKNTNNKPITDLHRKRAAPPRYLLAHPNPGTIVDKDTHNLIENAVGGDLSGISYGFVEKSPHDKHNFGFAIRQKPKSDKYEPPDNTEMSDDEAVKFLTDYYVRHKLHVKGRIDLIKREYNKKSTKKIAERQADINSWKRDFTHELAEIKKQLAANGHKDTKGLLNNSNYIESVYDNLVKQLELGKEKRTFPIKKDLPYKWDSFEHYMAGAAAKESGLKTTLALVSPVSYNGNSKPLMSHLLDEIENINDKIDAEKSKLSPMVDMRDAEKLHYLNRRQNALLGLYMGYNVGLRPGYPKKVDNTIKNRETFGIATFLKKHMYYSPEEKKWYIHFLGKGEQDQWRELEENTKNPREKYLLNALLKKHRTSGEDDPLLPHTGKDYIDALTEENSPYSLHDILEKTGTNTKLRGLEQEDEDTEDIEDAENTEEIEKKKKPTPAFTAYAMRDFYANRTAVEKLNDAAEHVAKAIHYNPALKGLLGAKFNEIIADAAKTIGHSPASSTQRYLFIDQLLRDFFERRVNQELQLLQESKK